MRSIFGCLPLTLFAIAAPPLFTEENTAAAEQIAASSYNPSQEAYEEACEPIECKTAPRIYNLYTDHIFGRGVGFNQGYTTLGFFTSPRFVGDWLPFLDLRGHIFNDGRWAANGGIGFRYFHEPRRFFFGANVFYDYRRYHQHNYNQIGAGLELTGEIFALRANGYIPVGSDKKIRNYTFKKFSGNNLLINENADLAMWGLDGEIDAHLISYKGAEFNFGAGPYYYQGDFGKSAVGGKVRASFLYRNFLYADCTTTFDRVFHWRCQGEVGFNFAFGPRFKNDACSSKCPLTCSNDAALMRRFTTPVERQEIVVVSKQKRQLTAIDPSTGLPFTFYFVNNLMILPGSGTYELPFSTLASAQTASNVNNTIYVHYGNGSTLGYNTGLVMKDNQRFFGSAVDQVVYTTNGPITIPALTPGFYPDITNPGAAANVVTLADNNEISGLQILSNAASLNGIIGTNVRRSPYIHDNRIFNFGTAAGAAEGGIRLTWTVATTVNNPLVIRNNLISITNGATGNNNGIYIDFAVAGTSQLEMAITNNTIVGNNVSGIVLETNNAATVANFIGTITNNNISGNTNNGVHYNIAVAGGRENLLMWVNNNEIAGNASAAGNAGILLTSGVSGTLYCNNNSISNNTNGALSATVGAFTMGIQSNNNFFFNNGTGVAFTTLVAGSFLDLEFRNNIGFATGFNLTRTGAVGTFQAHLSGNDGQLSVTGGVTLLP